MKTLIEERITELKEQRTHILKDLTERGKKDNLTASIVIHEAKQLEHLDDKLVELELMLHQAEHFYGSKKPNLKPKDNASK